MYKSLLEIFKHLVEYLLIDYLCQHWYKLYLYVLGCSLEKNDALVLRFLVFLLDYYFIFCEVCVICKGYFVSIGTELINLFNLFVTDNNSNRTPIFLINLLIPYKIRQRQKPPIVSKFNILPTVLKS